MNLLIASEERAAEDAKKEPERLPAIELEGVSVSYSAPQERVASFKEYAIRLLKGGVPHEFFHALNEVSLTIQPGECFGVVGHNGAGKSTLLKVISRIIRPTAGRAIVRGRLAPLLELGAGFHPELTGRENIFLNGTLLGHSQALMEELFDDIVDFAELREFIDAPLRTYSTGMAVRLGFAVATAVRPDVLLVDEVLAVGDENFQRKCAVRIGEFRQSGTTILLVTHDTNAVIEMCERALWLDHGRVKGLGLSEEVVTAYREANTQTRAPKRKRKNAPNKAAKATTENTATPAQLRQLAQPLRTTEWFYPFELPGRQKVAFNLPEALVHLHETRWQMVEQAVEEFCGGDWENVRCLDIGCNQGYFALQLARKGCAQVVGFDARPAQIRAADLIRRAWSLDNLQFRHLDLMKVNPYTFGQFEVVLLLGALHQYENPIGALRMAKALAKHMVIVETQLGFDQTGEINWGSHNVFKEVEGTFALLDRTDEEDTPWGSLTPLSLVPGRETLLWVMHKLGFKRVAELPLPPDAYEQFVSGKRIMLAGYL